MAETMTIARSAWPTLPLHHNDSGMILRHNHLSHMIFMDVSSIRLGLQVATLSEGLVPDLVPGLPRDGVRRAACMGASNCMKM